MVISIQPLPTTNHVYRPSQSQITAVGLSESRIQRIHPLGSTMPSLMDLPTETRVEIFRHLIPEQVTVNVEVGPARFLSGYIVLKSPLFAVPSNPALSLLLSNSAIKAEVLLLPKPVLVAYFGGACQWPHVTQWLRKTSPSYRANINRLEFFLSKHHTSSRTFHDPFEQQQLVDSANNEETAKIWEESHLREAERGFSHVECVHSRRWGAIVRNRTLRSENGVYVWEEYRWIVSGAKEFKGMPRW